MNTEDLPFSVLQLFISSLAMFSPPDVTSLGLVVEHFRSDATGLEDDPGCKGRQGRSFNIGVIFTFLLALEEPCHCV